MLISGVSRIFFFYASQVNFIRLGFDLHSRDGYKVEITTADIKKSPSKVTRLGKLSSRRRDKKSVYFGKHSIILFRRNETRKIEVASVEYRLNRLEAGGFVQQLYVA